MKAKKVIYKGEEYRSLYDLCKKLNLNYSTISSRIFMLGRSLEDAVEFKPVKKPASIKDHTGKIYANKKEMAEAWGIDYPLFLLRLKRGWSIERALTQPINSFLNRVIKDHEGNTFRSLQCMADAWGVSYQALEYRLNKGWSVEAALIGKQYRRKGFEGEYLDLTYKGQKFKSLSDIAKTYNISYGNLCRRLFVHKLPLDQAIEIKGRKMGIFSRDHLGNYFSSSSAMAEAWGLSFRTLNARLEKGWSIEHALTTPVRKRKINKK